MARAALALALALAGGGCGGAGTVEPDRTPVISITGIVDGQATPGPVTIGIAVDIGTYTASLNDEPFLSGGTVNAPGSYTLVVDARNGTATASESVEFTIILTGSTRLIVRILDLGANQAGGGGDAALLTDSSGAGLKHGLIDAGPAGRNASDPSFVLRRLQQLGVDTLEFIVLSHAHSDHFGGMTPVFENIHVRRFFYNGQARTFSAYNQLISTANQLAETVIVPSVIETVQLGFGPSATQTAVFTPLTSYLSNSSAESWQINEGSIGTEVTKGDFQMFFAGDGEIEANARWMTGFPVRTGALTALKVGHHGANDAMFDNGFSGSSAWLAHTDPTVAFVSANGETHPRINATNALLAYAGLTTYCTNVHGDVEIRVNEDGDFVLTVERNEGESCIPGSEAGT